MDSNNMIMTKSAGNAMRSKAVKSFSTRSGNKSAGKKPSLSKVGQATGGKMRASISYHESTRGGNNSGAPQGSGKS